MVHIAFQSHVYFPRTASPSVDLPRFKCPRATCSQWLPPSIAQVTATLTGGHPGNRQESLAISNANSVEPEEAKRGWTGLMGLSSMC